MATTTDSEPPLPKTQKAWLVTARGHPSNALTFTENHPVSSDLLPDEVLVKVQAAALNPMSVSSKLLTIPHRDK
jgi:hypothetical protein